jgi:hypothetical protein
MRSTCVTPILASITALVRAQVMNSTAHAQRAFKDSFARKLTPAHPILALMTAFVRMWVTLSTAHAQ